MGIFFLELVSESVSEGFPTYCFMLSLFCIVVRLFWFVLVSGIKASPVTTNMGNGCSMASANNVFGGI